MNFENFLERLAAIEARSPDAGPDERDLIRTELDALKREVESADVKDDERAPLLSRIGNLTPALSPDEDKPVNENAADPPVIVNPAPAEERHPAPGAEANNTGIGMLAPPAEPLAALAAPEPHAALDKPAVPLGPPTGPSGPAFPLGPPTDSEAPAAIPVDVPAEEAETAKEPGKEEPPPPRPISAEKAAEIARIETEVNQISILTEEFDINATRPRAVFELRNHIKELQKQLRAIPSARKLREGLRVRLQEVWQQTQDFLSKYTELGKKELAEFYERADKIAGKAEMASSFDSIRQTREEIKRVQQDLRTAHLKREEFQKIRKRLQGIWDLLDKLWVKLRDESKKEVEEFMPRVEEVREKVGAASTAEELKAAGDALKTTQAELKERAFPRSEKDKLYRILQKVWEVLQEKWNDLRAGKVVETLKFDEKLEEVRAVVNSAADAEGFRGARETVKSLQDEIKTANLPRRDRGRYYESLQEIYESLMKKQEEWYQQGAEGKD